MLVENQAPEFSSDESEEDLFTVLASIAPDGESAISMKVYQMRGGKREWLFDAMPADAENMQEKLRDDYGGGDFEVWIKKGNRIARRKALAIARPIRKEPAPIKSSDAEMASVMMQGFNGLAAGIAELGKLLVTQQQTQMMTAPVKSPQEQLTDTLNMMVQMKALFDQGTKVDPMDQFLKGVNFAKEISIENDPDNDPSAGKVLMSLADKLAPVLGAVMTAPAAPANPATAPRPQIKPQMPPQMPPVNPQPTIKEPTPVDQNMFIKMAIKNQLAQLLKFAQSGRDPEIYATVVLDSVPDQYFEKFAEFITKPNAVDELAALDPAVNTFRPWFDSLHGCIVDQLTPDEPETTIGNIEQTGNTIDVENYSAIDGDPVGGSGNPPDA